MLLSHSLGETTNKIVWGHDGRRGASNWKGGASYFVIRDSVPVYYWPSNHGAFALYDTAKDFIQRNFFFKEYMSNLASNPNWNNLRVNFGNVIKNPSITWLFAKNQYYSLQDVGLYIKGTELRGKSEQTAKATTALSSLTPKIFNHLDAKRQSNIRFKLISFYYTLVPGIIAIPLRIATD